MKKLCGWGWLDYPELGSTNDKALELSAAAPSPRYVITAASQTGGRGRRGRRWIGLEGNLFASLALPLEFSRFGQLIFVVSLSLQQVIAALLPGIPVQLKWPNDVLVAGGKISGILLEKGAGEYIIVGIGVNIMAMPGLSPSLRYEAASLNRFGAETDRITFLQAYLQQLNLNLELWEREGFAPIKQNWLQAVRGLNEEINITTEKTTICGIFKGIDDAGLLLLEQDGRLTKISAGDVFYKEEN